MATTVAMLEAMGARGKNTESKLSLTLYIYNQEV